MFIKKFISLMCFVFVTSIAYCDISYLNKLDYQTVEIKNIENKKLKNTILKTVQDLGFFITNIKSKEKNYRVYAINYLKNKGTKLDIEIENKRNNEHILRINIGVGSDGLEHLDLTKKGGEQAYQNFFNALGINLNN